MSITIRPEVGSDYSQITDVIDQAFAGKPYAEGNESDFVIKLSELDVLTRALWLSLEVLLLVISRFASQQRKMVPKAGSRLEPSRFIQNSSLSALAES